MEIAVRDSHNKETGAPLKIEPKVFDQPFNMPLVHQIVTAQFAAARSGTKAQKGRSQVSGGGRKPWRQKGTGRARAGTIRSPLWRKGGTVFAAVPRDHTQKVNKKMYRAAMRAIYSELIRQERLVVIDTVDFEVPKTKEAIALLRRFGVEKALILTTSCDENLHLSTRNIPGVWALEVSEVNPVDLVQAEKVLMTRAALQAVEGMLA